MVVNWDYLKYQIMPRLEFVFYAIIIKNKVFFSRVVTDVLVIAVLICILLQIKNVPDANKMLNV